MTPGQTLAFHFDHLLLHAGWARQARMVCRGGQVESIIEGVGPEPRDIRLDVGVPGMPNVHSHAFQRAMSGLAERRGPSEDSFWTWRELMYRFVGRITPEQLSSIAALAFMEMLESGFTRVGEFHYLHHDRDGGVFSDPSAMSAAIVEAADETGIGLTHLPVFYAHSGFGGTRPTREQSRFVHDLDSFGRLLDALPGTLGVLPDAVLGLAPHSLRAVTPDELSILERLAGNGPVHIHIAEQLREVEDCVAWSGSRPVEWLLGEAEVNSRWCLVHATHANEREIDSIARSGAVVGLCPVTEANLGDGIFPAARLMKTGGRFAVGSDSNVLIDMSEELRLLEYGQRLDQQRRNVLAYGPDSSTGSDLYRACISGGNQALGCRGALTPGSSADFFTLDADHPSLINRDHDRMVDSFLFGAGRQAINGVWRRGEQIVERGRHARRERIVRRYREVLSELIRWA